MNVLEQISNHYLASLVLGLLYWLTICALVCIPYLVSYIAGVGSGFKTGIKITAFYNSGRIVAYAIIGTAVGFICTVITEEILTSNQQYTSIAFGVIVTVIGAATILKKIKPCNCIQQQQPQTDRLGLSKLTTRFDLLALTMGFIRGLFVGPPLVALLLCYFTISQVNCTALSILLGAGTALSSVLFLGGSVGSLLNKVMLWRTLHSRIGGTALDLT
jgi:sulfite exporter TauE/SafE